MNDSDLDLIELTDAGERNSEGGGAMPLAMQTQQPAQLGRLGQSGSHGVWYKQPTWLALMALGAAATGFVIYAAMKKRK
jgi:hypothetical protein